MSDLKSFFVVQSIELLKRPELSIEEAQKLCTVLADFLSSPSGSSRTRSDALATSLLGNSVELLTRTWPKGVSAEPVQRAACSAILSFCKCAPQEVDRHGQFWSHDSRMPLCAFVTVTLLDIINPSLNALLAPSFSSSSLNTRCGSRELRIDALDCLHEFWRFVSSASAARQVLPGVASSLGQVVLGSFKQGHRLTARAVDVWAQFLVRVLADRSQSSASAAPALRATRIETLRAIVSDAEQRQSSSAGKSASDDDDDDAWRHVAARKLAPLVERVFDVRRARDETMSSWHVRLAIGQAARLLLSRCAETLGERSMLACARLLAAQRHDEHDAVRSAALNTLDNEPALLARVRALLKTSVLDLLLVLPRTMRTEADAAAQLGCVHVLDSYVALLGDTDVDVLLSGNSLGMRRFVAVVCELFRVDSRGDSSAASHRSLVSSAMAQSSSSSSSTTTTPTMSPFPRLHFANFHGERVADAGRQMCANLARRQRASGVHALLDRFAPLLAGGDDVRFQAAIAIGQFARGFGEAGASRDSCAQLAERILADVFDERVWPPSALRGADAAFRAQLVEVLAHVAVGLVAPFRDEIEPFLIDALYPLVETLGHHDELASGAAYAALQRVAAACRFDSVTALINGNADYLLDTLASRMRYLDQYPSTPCTLEGVTRWIGAEALPLFASAIDDIFRALDQHHRHMSYDLLRILRVIARMLADERPQEQASSSNKTLLDEVLSRRQIHASMHAGNDGGGDAEHDDDIGDYFRRYHEHKDRQAAMLSDDDDDDDSGSADQDDGAESSGSGRPADVRLDMAEKILMRCQHFVSSDSVDEAVVVLDTICSGLDVLCDDINRLRPMIYTLWHPLVCRMRRIDRANDESASDRYVASLLYVVRAVETMARHCSEFLLPKFDRDFWPLAVELVRRQAPLNVSSVARRDRSFCFGNRFKMQLAIVNTVAVLYGNATRDVVDVADVFALYLDERQHEQLQRAAVALFKRLIDADADALWQPLMALAKAPPPKRPAESTTLHVIDAARDLDARRAVPLYFPTLSVDNLDLLESNAALLLSYLESEE
jgi:TELO2-interacting protein 1